MKKLILSLFCALLLTTLNEVFACQSVTMCANAERISCTGTRCEAGSSYVTCYGANGSVSSSYCDDIP